MVVALWLFFHDKAIMKKTLTVFARAVGGLLCMVVIAICIMAIAPRAQAIDTTDITIIADASLIQPLRLITQHYARREHIGITLISDARHYPVDRISEGLSADMVITSNSQAHKNLEHMGLADRFATQIIAREPMLLVHKHTKSPAQERESLASATTPTLVTLDDPNFPNIQAMSAEIMRDALRTEPELLRVTNHDAWHRALEAPNHYALIPYTMRERYPSLTIARMLETQEGMLYVQGDVLAGTRMRESRALLAFLTGPDAAAIWRRFGFTPENY
jgi:ABC-type molybdate transport system substrate-binding protein